MDGRLANYRCMGAAALAFMASAAVTIAWCGSMSGMGGMAMPGGWTMSMTWMRMPGQGWPGAAATFLGMWSVMMVAMMLPAVTPALLRYRRALGAVGAARRRTLTGVAGLGYLLVWMLSGVAAYPAGVGLAELAMRFPALSSGVPFAAGLAMLVAGILQLSAWKSRQLACCRREAEHAMAPAGIAAAWRFGLRLGARCSYCCAPLMLLLFVLGVMELWAMALVTVAISLERLLESGGRIARVVGAVLTVTGVVSMLRAMISAG